MRTRLLFLAGVALVTASLSIGQSGPHVTGVEPETGKADTNFTIMGENLGSDTVVGVYLSDDASDHQVMVVEQAADKIVVRVPQVTAGGYNIAIHVGNNIFIQPVRFTVE